MRASAEAVYGPAARDYRPQAEKSRLEKGLQWFAQTPPGGKLFVEVTIEGRRRPMRARVAEGQERERLWSMVCDHYSGYATYQRRAGERVIPLVVLEPRAVGAPAP